MATPTTTPPAPNLKALYDQGVALGNKASKITGVPFTPQMLSGEVLQGNPAFKLTPPAPSTSDVSFQSFLESGANRAKDSFTTGLETETKANESKYKSSFKEYLAGLMGRKGNTELSAEAYSKEGGVDDIKEELDVINNKLLDEQVSLRHQIEDIEKNEAGRFGGAVADEVNRVRMDSLRRQADLSVIQMGIQGRYDSAKEIADRAVAIEFEREENYNEALKLQYEDNKSLFTTAEQREFEAAQADRERKLTEEKEDRQAVSDLAVNAMSNGAPASVVQQALKARTKTEAIGLLGNYIDAVDMANKRAQTAKIWQDINAEDDKNSPDGASNIMQLAKFKGNVDLITDLASDDYLKTAVGPNALSRISLANIVTGGKQDFVAGVEQLRSQLSLDSLIGAKERGATFGALSDSELQILASSASKLGTWAIKNPQTGQVVGYRASEKDFKAEMDKINNFAKLDYLLKGGDPKDVNVEVQDDGSYWTTNSDGSYVRLE